LKNTFILLFGCVLVLFILVQQTPAMIQGLFRGITMSGGGAGMSAAAMGASAAVFAAKMAGPQMTKAWKTVGGAIAKGMNKKDKDDEPIANPFPLGFDN